jgi:DNA ligase (NAD+)
MLTRCLIQLCSRSAAIRKLPNNIFASRSLSPRSTAKASFRKYSKKKEIIPKTTLSRVEELRSNLKKYSEAYYNESKSLVTDQEYDALFKELQQLEAQYPALKTKNTPTELVGAKVKDGVVHSRPMLSLSNTYNEEEVIKFDQRITKLLEGEKYEYTLEMKYDGVALSLIYKKGKLVRALTRGDGIKGEDVTENVKQFVDLPKSLQTSATKVAGERKSFADQLLDADFEVRGEVVLSKEVFKKINEEAEKLGRNQLFANPRNLTSGIINRKSSNSQAESKTLKYYENHKLNFHAYSLLSDIKDRKQTQSGNLKLLQSFGFSTDEKSMTTDSIDKVMEYTKTLEAQRVTLPYEIDGVVVKVNSIEQQEFIGSTSSVPRWAIAYKFDAMKAVTTVKDIQLQVGRTGKVTPVAIVDTVLLSGISITRATLHNRQYIDEKNIRIGTQVIIERSADVIPKIVGRASDEISPDENTSVPIDWKTCPCELKVPLEERAGYVDVFCTSSQCPEQLTNKIHYFAGKNALKIDGLGKKIVQQLIDWNYVQSIPDIFSLRQHREEMILQPGWGEKSVDNLLQNIEKAKEEADWSSVITGLGLPHVGYEAAKALAAKFPTAEALKEATVDEIMEIQRFGPNNAPAIVNALQSSLVVELIDKLAAIGLGGKNKLSETVSGGTQTNPSSSTKAATGTSEWHGKNWVFSGALDAMSRSDAGKKVEKYLGGTVKTTVSKGSILVTGKAAEGSTSKAKKALDIGATVLNETEFLELLHSASSSEDE